MHLFCEDPSAIDRLRADIAADKAKQWADLLPVIEKACAVPYAPVTDFDDTYGQGPIQGADCSAGMLGAFGYLVTGERRFFESARDHLMPMLYWTQWNWPLSCTDGRWLDLRSAGAVKAFALFLDWCRDAISDDERNRMVLGLENFGARPVLRDHDVQVAWYDEAGRVNNWVAVMNCGVGLAALLLWREKPIFRDALSICVKHMRRYLDWVEEDGATTEGGGYWLYGMTHLLTFLEALRVNRAHVPPEVLETGACDWLTQSAKLSRTAMFPLSGCLDGKFAMLFGDSDPIDMGKFMEPCALLARSFRDGEVQWYVRRMACADPLALIWLDPSLPEREPEPGLMTRLFSVGWLLVRESPAVENGFFFALRGGSNNQSHTHRDVGNFLFWYAGEPLICDPGRPTYCAELWSNPDGFLKKSTRGHNVPLVDGLGQGHGEETAGDITDLSGDGRAKKYQIAIHSPYNGIARQVRTFEIDLREDPVITMEDDIRFESERGVEFLFHHQGEVRIEGNAVWITRPKAELRMDFESPVALVIAAVEHEDSDHLVVTPQTRAARHQLRVVMTCRKRAAAG